MFGEKATVHLKIISNEEAQELVDEHTRIMATRVTHERLARNQFSRVSRETVRHVQMEPGVTAIHMHYRGPPIPDNGKMPFGGLITCYLIEVGEYQEP
mgnify:CR=1 FL=1